MYDDDWYIGIANDHSIEYQDVHFKFLKKAFQIIFLDLGDRMSIGFLSQRSSAIMNLWKSQIPIETKKLHRKN